jgi:hypothetical protein
MLVAEKEPPGVAVENRDRFRGMFDQGPETRFAGGEGGRAFAHAPLEALVQLQQFGLGFFAFRDVARNDHVNGPPVHQDWRGRNLDGNVAPVPVPHHPFEPMAVVFFNHGNDLRRPVGAGRAVGLDGRGEILRSGLQQLFFALGANEPDRRLVAIDEHPGLRIKQPDRVNTALEKAPKH